MYKRILSCKKCLISIKIKDHDGNEENLDDLQKEINKIYLNLREMRANGINILRVPDVVLMDISEYCCGGFMTICDLNKCVKGICVDNITKIMIKLDFKQYQLQRRGFQKLKVNK